MLLMASHYELKQFKSVAGGAEDPNVEVSAEKAVLDAAIQASIWN